jgi:8-oxo-dGTP pyrophosphatase MutT (NUDIX family)
LPNVEWIEHGERSIYDSPWVSLHLVDVEVPGGARFEHHVIRRELPAAGVVVHDSSRGLLLLWRHRFITRTWGWEVPAGRVEHGESCEQAAAREVLEETGWAPGPLRRLFGYHPTNGISDQRFELFVADGATHVGAPSDPSEADRVEWVAVDEVRRLVAEGQVGDGLSLTTLLWWLLHEAL